MNILNTTGLSALKWVVLYYVTFTCSPVPKWINGNLEGRLERLGNGGAGPPSPALAGTWEGGGDEDVPFLYFLFPLELLTEGKQSALHPAALDS